MISDAISFIKRFTTIIIIDLTLIDVTLLHLIYYVDDISCNFPNKKVCNNNFIDLTLIDVTLDVTLLIWHFWSDCHISEADDTDARGTAILRERGKWIFVTFLGFFTVSDPLGKHDWFQKCQHKRVFEPLEAPEAGFGLTRGREAPSEAESGRGGLQRLKNDRCWPFWNQECFHRVMSCKKT